MDSVHVVLWAILVILFAVSAPMPMPREQYTPQLNYGARAVEDLRSKRVQAAKNSVIRVTWANVTLKPMKKGVLESMRSIVSPRETVRFSGRPKYILKHNVIIAGKSVSFDGVGRTVTDATKAANARAATILAEIEKALATASLIAEAAG